MNRDNKQLPHRQTNSPVKLFQEITGERFCEMLDFTYRCRRCVQECERTGGSKCVCPLDAINVSVFSMPDYL